MIFGGLVISTLPKFGYVLAGLPFDLPAKRGPLSALQLALGRGQKFFVFFSFLGADPQTGSRIRKLTDRIFRGPKGLRCVKIWSGYLQGVRRNFGENFEKVQGHFNIISISSIF